MVELDIIFDLVNLLLDKFRMNIRIPAMDQHRQNHLPLVST